MSRLAFSLLLACMAASACICAAQDGSTVNWAGSCAQSATFSNGQYTCTTSPLAAPFFVSTTASANALVGYSYVMDQTTVTNPDGESFTIPAESSNGTLAVSPVTGAPNCYADSNGDQFFMNLGSITFPNGDKQALLYYFAVADMASGHTTCPTSNSTLACSDSSFPILCTLTLQE